MIGLHSANGCHVACLNGCLWFRRFFSPKEAKESPKGTDYVASHLSSADSTSPLASGSSSAYRAAFMGALDDMERSPSSPVGRQLQTNSMNE